MREIMEVSDRSEVHSLQGATRLCATSLLQQLSNSAYRASSPSLKKNVLEQHGPSKLSLTPPDSRRLAAELPNGAVVSSQNDAVRATFSFATTSHGGGVHTGGSAWRCTTASAGEAEEDIKEKCGETKIELRQHLSQMFPAANLSNYGPEYTCRGSASAGNDAQVRSSPRGQSFQQRYPSVDISSCSDRGGSNVPCEAVKQCRPSVSITAPDFAQPIETLNQYFCVTLPSKHGAPKCYQPPAVAAITAACATVHPPMAVHTTAAVASTPHGEIEIPAVTVAASDRDAESSHAHNHGYSTQSVFTRYRVHCRLVAKSGFRRHFLVEAEPDEINNSTLLSSADSSAVNSEYIAEHLGFLSKGLKPNIVGYSNTLQKELHMGQSQSLCLPQGKEQVGALHTVPTYDCRMPGLTCDDANVLAGNDIECVVPLSQQTYLQRLDELRKPHEQPNVRSLVQSHTGCADEREAINRRSAKFASMWPTKSVAGGDSFTRPVELFESMQRSTSAAAIPSAAAKYPQFTSVTIAPSSFQDFVCATHEYTVASDVPGTVVSHCAASNKASSLVALSSERAMHGAAHACVGAPNGAATAVAHPSGALHQNRSILPYNQFGAGASKNTGLRACRPLDPKTLERRLEGLPVTLLPSLYTPSPFSFERCARGEIASTVTGTHTYKQIIPCGPPENLSGEEREATGQQHSPALSRHTPVPCSSPEQGLAPIASATQLSLNSASLVCQNDMDAKSNDPDPRKEPVGIIFSRARLAETVQSQHERSGNYDAWYPRNDLNEIHFDVNEQQPINQPVQGASACLQNVSNATCLQAANACAFRSTSAGTGVNTKARLDASQSIKGSAEVPEFVSEDPLNIQLNRCLRGWSPTSSAGDNFCKYGKLAVDAQQELPVPENRRPSQHSISVVWQKTTASPVTVCGTGLRTDHSDFHADTTMSAAVQHEALGEDLQLHKLQLASVSNCNAEPIYIWTACGAPLHRESCTTVVNTSQGQQSLNRNDENQKRSASPREQSASVPIKPSTAQHNNYSSVCCAHRMSASNEYNKTTLETLKESRRAEGRLRMDRVVSSNAPYCDVAERATQDAEQQGVKQLQNNRRSLRGPPCSDALPSSAAASAAELRTYVAPPPGRLADAKTKDVVNNADERRVQIKMQVQHFSETTGIMQPSTEYNTASRTMPQCSAPQTSVLDEKLLEISHKPHAVLLSRVQPGAEVIERYARVTPDTSTVIPGSSAVTEWKGAVLHASGGPPRMTIAAKDTNALKECSSTSMLKQFCSRTLRSIKEKKREQEQRGRQIEIVGPTMVTTDKDTRRASLAKPSPMHYYSQLKHPAEVTQLSPLQQAAVGESAPQVTLPCCLSVASARDYLASEPQLPDECIRTLVLNDTAEIQTATAASGTAGTLHPWYATANRGRSRRIKPRQTAQFSNLSPRQETSTAETALRITTILPHHFTVVSGCPVDRRVERAENRIHMRALQHTDELRAPPAAVDAVNAVEQPYTIASRGRSIALKPRRLALSIPQSSLQRAAFKQVPRVTAGVDRCCVVAPPGCPIHTELSRSEKFIPVNLLQDAHNVEVTSPSPYAVSSSSPAAVYGSPGDSRSGGSEGCVQANTSHHTVDIRSVSGVLKATRTSHRHGTRGSQGCSKATRQRRVAESIRTILLQHVGTLKSVLRVAASESLTSSAQAAAESFN